MTVSSMISHIHWPPRPTVIHGAILLTIGQNVLWRGPIIAAPTQVPINHAQSVLANASRGAVTVMKAAVTAAKNVVIRVSSGRMRAASATLSKLVMNPMIGNRIVTVKKVTMAVTKLMPVA